MLILPNLGALGDGQCGAVRRFVEGGGGLLASGETSRYDEWGDLRSDFALADLFGVHATDAHHGASGPAEKSGTPWSNHTYLRLSPELRAGVDGPHTGDEPVTAGKRHAALEGFAETDILPFGGRLEVVQADPAAIVPLTYVPPFPIYPPETAWMRHPSSNLPALAFRDGADAGRVAYLAADLDRCYGRDNLPDHATLLANLVRWAARDRIPLRVDGPGLLDCHLYRQSGRLVLHLVNLTSAGTWRAPIDELVPVGPLRVRVELPDDVSGQSARLLVAATTAETDVQDGWAALTVPSITDHEIIVVS